MDRFGGKTKNMSFQFGPSVGPHYTTPVVFSGQQPTQTGESGLVRGIWILIILLISVGLCYLAYQLFVKDRILLFKARRQRTTTEIGFGQTPRVVNGQAPNG